MSTQDVSVLRITFRKPEEAPYIYIYEVRTSTLYGISPITYKVKD